MTNPTWTRVEPSWGIDRLRQEAYDIIAIYKLAVWSALKDHPDLLAKVHDAVFAEMKRKTKTAGVYTPIELAGYFADLIVNFTGGKVSISGDEKEASLMYEDIPNWDQFKQALDLTPQSREQMTRQIQSSMNLLGNRLGMTIGEEIDFERPFVKMTFRR